MMVALLHSNGQLRTERDGDTEEGCQKPAVQQKTTDDDDDARELVHSGLPLVLKFLKFFLALNFTLYFIVYFFRIDLG